MRRRGTRWSARSMTTPPVRVPTRIRRIATRPGDLAGAGRRRCVRPASRAPYVGCASGAAFGRRPDARRSCTDRPDRIRDNNDLPLPRRQDGARSRPRSPANARPRRPPDPQPHRCRHRRPAHDPRVPHRRLAQANLTKTRAGAKAPDTAGVNAISARPTHLETRASWLYPRVHQHLTSCLGRTMLPGMAARRCPCAGGGPADWGAVCSPSEGEVER